jgi:tungstate transport system ATP-binding protein
MSDGPLLSLRDVKFGYGPAFELGIDRLDLDPGEILALLGPTGAGKSTLLRIIGGLETPAVGEAHLLGHDLTHGDLPLAVLHRVTLVFQRPPMLIGSVRANVEYGLRLRGAPSDDGSVPGLLDRLGLVGLASQAARTLSVGQQQLVALARALAIEPDVLLLDEPTAGLDPAHVALAEGVILDENRRRGTAIIWATHNLFQARRVAHRVALLLEGKLVEVRDTAGFFESPTDPRTAAFVRGEMIY